MIATLKSQLFGWQCGSESEYIQCHTKFGGSVNTHPDFLRFFHRMSDCQPQYFIRRDQKEELSGAYCVWGNDFLAGENRGLIHFGLKSYPVNADELILPICDDVHVCLPFKTKYLSPINRKKIINASYSLNSHREICLAKGCAEHGLSAKSKTSRNHELRTFLSAGGSIIDQSAYSPYELTLIFSKLFKIRWGHDLTNFAETQLLIESLRDHLFGHVLLLNGEPCAFQLITMAESPEWISFDYINGGVDTNFKQLSPGTVVTWLNVKHAYEYCQARKKQMRYSFGRPTADYKDRWCYRAPLGRVLTL
jgi:hypothetical protein